MLPHDEVKQAGPRRLGSSSTTALGVAVRIRESFAFVRVYVLFGPSSHAASGAQKLAFDSFRPFISTAARTAVEILGVEEHLTAVWQLAALMHMQCAAAA